MLALKFLVVVFFFSFFFFFFLILVCIRPGAAWHCVAGNGRDARASWLFQWQIRTSERLLHSQFACLGQRELLREPPHGSRGWGAMPRTPLPLTLLAQTQCGCSQQPKGAISLGGKHGGGGRGALESPVLSASVPGASAAAKARVPHHPCRHRGISWRAGGRILAQKCSGRHVCFVNVSVTSLHGARYALNCHPQILPLEPQPSNVTVFGGLSPGT